MAARCNGVQPFHFTKQVPAVIVPLHRSGTANPQERIQRMSRFEIETEYIKLDSLLKAVNAVGSGGEAKIIIGDGLVLVNGEAERRRGRKLFPGDRVVLGEHEFEVASGA
jgi:ribosome-associated protein